jgi:hypothetical protein
VDYLADKNQNNIQIGDFSWCDQLYDLRQEYARLQQEHIQVQQEHIQVQQDYYVLRSLHDEQTAKHNELLNKLSAALQFNHNLGTEVQILKDEIARLKNAPPRPKIPPSRLEPPAGKSGNKIGKEGQHTRGKHPRAKKTGLTFHKTERLTPGNIPKEAIFKGIRKYDVQDLVFQAYNTRYEIERWQLPDGTYIEGKLPSHIQGHYGASLRAYVISQTHSCRVTEELILEQLHMCGIAISAGQLNAMLTKGHDGYHTENAEILKAVLATGEIQTDDVGTRHRGKNCYTNIICNEFFVHMATTDSKSRINFLKILTQGRNEYRFNQDAYDYLSMYEGTERLIQALKLRNNPVINTDNPKKAFLDQLGHVKESDIRLLTEASLVASLIEHGVPRDLNIHSDDAGQFDVFKQSLCWIHEERHYRKLIPVQQEMTVEIEKMREGIWQLYKALKAYKEAPNEAECERISLAFDNLFKPKEANPYKVINDRLALTYAKRDRLLFVLKRPTIALHNNASETGGRGAKVKSKISGGTRTDMGRKAWDTFGSLNLTCRRLGISFYAYLMDRFLNFQAIGRLATIVCDRIRAAHSLVETDSSRLMSVSEATPILFDTS